MVIVLRIFEPGLRQTLDCPGPVRTGERIVFVRRPHPIGVDLSALVEKK